MLGSTDIEQKAPKFMMLKVIFSQPTHPLIIKKNSTSRYTFQNKKSDTIDDVKTTSNKN